MSEYTPTTEEVREAASPEGATGIDGESFDIWMAIHDAEIAKHAAVKALRDAAEDWSRWEATAARDGTRRVHSRGRPEEWLNARADRMEGH